jgi:hypothetical protein
MFLQSNGAMVLSAKNANIPITVKALTNLIDNVPDAVP